MNPANYENDVKLISSYLIIGGMFETKMGQNYDLYNNINEDAFSWKFYSQNGTLSFNN